MEGVTILSQITGNTMEWLGIFGGSMLGFGIGYFIIWLTEYIRKIKGNERFHVAIVIMLIGAICFGFSRLGLETRYEVIIDDSVSMVEFNEHYEIIEQRDLIYVVREKHIDN